MSIWQLLLPFLIGFFLMLAFHASVRAEDARCQDVRVAVASYGSTAALAWARRNGYSEEQIKQARRCLIRTTRSR